MKRAHRHMPSWLRFAIAAALAFPAQLPLAYALDQRSATRPDSTRQSLGVLEIASNAVTAQLARAFPAVPAQAQAMAQGYAQLLRDTDRPVVVLVTAQMLGETEVDLPVVMDTVYGHLARELGVDEEEARERLQFWLYDPQATDEAQVWTGLQALNRRILAGAEGDVPEALADAEWIGRRHFARAVAGDLRDQPLRTAEQEWEIQGRRPVTAAEAANARISGATLEAKHAFFAALAQEATAQDWVTVTLSTREATGEVIAETVTLPAGRVAELKGALAEYLALLIQSRGLINGCTEASVSVSGSEHLPDDFLAEALAEDSLLAGVRTTLQMQYGKSNAVSSFNQGIVFSTGLLDPTVEARPAMTNAQLETKPNVRVVIAEQPGHAGALGAAYLSLQAQQEGAEVVDYKKGESIGADIGGTSVKLAIIINGEKVTLPPVPWGKTPGDQIGEFIEQQLQVFGQQHGVNPWEQPLFITVPGPMTPDGDIITIINLERLRPGTQASLERLAQRRPNVQYQNDANVAAVQQMVDGGLAGNVILNTLGTGLGFAVIADDKLGKGPQEAHLKLRYGAGAFYGQGFEFHGDLEDEANNGFVYRRARELGRKLGVKLPYIRFSRAGEVVAAWLELEQDHPLRRIAEQVYEEFGENLAVECREVARVTGRDQWTLVLVGGMARVPATDYIQRGIDRGLNKTLVAPPARSQSTLPLISPAAAGQRNVVGMYSPMFQERSERDWGIMDFDTMKEVVDFHHLTGQNAVQSPPMNMSSASNSPYSVASSRLLDPIYISIDALLDDLEAQGLPVDAARAYVHENRDRIRELRDGDRVNYAGVRKLKMEALQLVWDAVRNQTQGAFYQEFLAFQQNHPEWEEVENHLLYTILKQKAMEQEDDDGVHWTQWRNWDWRRWDEGLRDRDPVAMQAAKDQYREEMLFAAFAEFVAERQQGRLQAYGRQQGVEFMIDIPFALDGADIWLHPEVFGLDAANDYRRKTTQGVPPEKAYPTGQYWQFYPYDWSNPATIPFVLGVFGVNQKRAAYIRLDHVLGYYRTYHFTEDIDAKMTIKNLGLHEELRRLQQQGRTAGTPDAKREAARQAQQLIQGRLAAMRGAVPADLQDTLPDDAVGLTVDEEGNLLPNGMVMIARQVPPEKHGETLPEDHWMARRYVVEKAVHQQGQQYWDFVRVTPDQEIGDEGFMYEYLFADDAGDVREDDSIRLGYFKRAPGEAMMAQFLQAAQEQGTTLIWETLGVVPPEIQASVERLGGTNYIPVIWGQESAWGEGDAAVLNPFHPDNHKANAFVTFGLHDSGTMVDRWTKELSTELKTAMLTKWFGKAWGPEDLNSLTRQVRRALLLEVYQSRSRIAMLTWIDILGLGDEYRLNRPGTQEGQWEVRLPLYLTIEQRILAAKRGDCDPQVRRAVEFLRGLIEEGGRAPAVLDENEPQFLNSGPEVGAGVEQIREIGGEPFLLDAYTAGSVEVMAAAITDEATGQLVATVPLETAAIDPASNTHGLPQGVVKWSGRWTAPHAGRYQVAFVINGQPLPGTAVLWAVAPGTDLNPLSPTYGQAPGEVQQQAEETLAQVIVLGQETAAAEALAAVRGQGHATAVGAAIPDADSRPENAQYSGGLALLAGLEAGLSAAEGRQPQPPVNTKPSDADPVLFVADTAVEGDLDSTIESMRRTGIAG